MEFSDQLSIGGILLQVDQQHNNYNTSHVPRLFTQLASVCLTFAGQYEVEILCAMSLPYDDTISLISVHQSIRCLF